MAPSRRHRTRFFTATKRAHSEKLRKQGNGYYGRALQDGLAPVIAEDRLLRAIKFYREAYDAADGDKDSMSSAMKNTGLAYFRLASFAAINLDSDRDIYERAPLERRENEIIDWFEKAFLKFREACKLGANVKGSAWLAGVNEKTYEMYKELLDFLGDFENLDRKVGKLFKISKVIFEGKMLCELFHHTAEMLFHEAVICLGVKDFKGSLRYLHEMHFPIEEGLKYAPDHYYLRQELNILRQDAAYQMATAESMQANAAAKVKLKNLLLDEEYLLMDGVWDTLDEFKSAALKAREMDLEQEAIAVYHQGVIYRDIFKLKYRTKSLFKHVFFLCEAAKPRVFFFEDWYGDCMRSLKEYQDEARERDEDEQQKKKKAHLEKLKPALDAITGLSFGESHQLIRHLYKTHKPKVPNQKMSEEDIDALQEIETAGNYCEKKNKRKKMLLLKALQDYHPDKNTEFDEEWVVLCEEISKAINNYYERIKG